MTDAPSSDALKNLVWFLVGLAMLGIILALMVYYTGFVPVGPVAGPPPANPVY